MPCAWLRRFWVCVNRPTSPTTSIPPTNPTPMFDHDTLHRTYQALADPWVRFNFVSSLDGAATVDGLSGGLNDPWDLRVFETLRAQAHAVVVGAGTIRNEGYDAVFLPDDHLAWRRARGWQDHPRSE